MATYPNGEAFANELLSIAAGTGLYPDFSDDSTIPSAWKNFWGEVGDLGESAYTEIKSNFGGILNILLNIFDAAGFSPSNYSSSAEFWSALPMRLRAYAAVETKDTMSQPLTKYTETKHAPWYQAGSLVYVGADLSRPQRALEWPIFIELAPSEGGIGIFYNDADITEIQTLTESQAPGALTTITLKTAGKQIPKNILILAEGTWCDVTMGSETLYSPSSELITLNCSGRATPDDIVITWDRS